MGSQTISKLLVANRGEIARRILRTCREMGIATVAVYSDPDADAPHVVEADEAVRLPGDAADATYLRADLLIAAARRAGADAVHPGYGFLAENADFVRACAAAGLTFVGPSAHAVETMGSKLAAKALARQVGVPVLTSVEVSEVGEDELAKAAGEIGYPLLVKASGGGGGRGMRIVAGPEELGRAIEAARREAAAAFGDPTVFCERLLPRPRHVEVQVLGDTHGQIVALFERECSIQRRHQKIIEECPSPAVDETLRARLGAAAVAVARAVGYVGVGTVEFLLAADGAFAFLEMNTRLQVEHPVTELVTGLDLVALQLLVAQGEPLPAAARDPRLHGHAIEARLYAEDPVHDFAPQTGTLTAFEISAGPDLRVDAGVRAGSTVSHHYDPLLAKVVAWAPQRRQAVARLADALHRARIHGVATNRDLLVRILRHPQFLAGQTDTEFLVRHPPAELGRPLAGRQAQRLHALAASLALAAHHRSTAPVLGSLPSGWRNNPSTLQRVTWSVGSERIAVGYAFSRDGLRAEVDGEPVDVVVHTVTPELVDLTVAGIRRRYAVALRFVEDGQDPGGPTVHAAVDSPLGSTTLTRCPRFPDPARREDTGSLTAPMPGTVVCVHVAPGDQVSAGQELLVIEAMKMEHPVRSPTAGVVAEVAAAPGAAVAGGDVLLVVDSSGSSGETGGGHGLS